MEYLNVSVGTLLQQHPWAQDVLEWHGVDVDRIDPCWSLSALCWLEGLNRQALVRDLLAAHPDRNEEDMLQFLAEGTPPEAELEEVSVDLDAWYANDDHAWWELAS